MFNACVVPLVLEANVAIEYADPAPTELLPYCAMQFTVCAWLMCVEAYWKLWLRVQVPDRVWLPTLTVARLTPPVECKPYSVESIALAVEKLELCAWV